VNEKRDRRCYWKGRHLRQPRAKEGGRTDKGIAKDVEELKVFFNAGDQGVLRQGERATGWFFLGWNSKTSESKVSETRMVEGLGGEVTARGVLGGEIPPKGVTRSPAGRILENWRCLWVND